MAGRRPSSSGREQLAVEGHSRRVDGWMTVSEAAAALGVQPEHVRELVQAGVLSAAKPAHGIVLISQDSVRARRAASPSAGRPLSGKNAWAMLWVVGDRRPEWVSPEELVRVRKYARRPLSQWSGMLARRARVHHVRVPEFTTRRITDLDEVGVGGTDAAIAHGASLMRSDPYRKWECYLTVAALAAVRDMRGIGWDSSAPNLILRELPRELPAEAVRVLTDHDVVPREVAAADLLDQSDERSRRVAAELLRRNDD